MAAVGLTLRQIPSEPPPTGVSWNTKQAICAKASVTMMKQMPFVLSTNRPITSAASAASPTAAGKRNHRLAASYFGLNNAAAQAAMPKQAACPRLTRPVKPTSRSRLMAKIAITSILDTISTQKDSPVSGTQARIASTTNLRIRETCAFMVSALLQDAFGTPQQHRGHHQVHHHAGDLGQQHFAEGVGEAHDQRGHERTPDRSDAPDHHDHEGDDQHLSAHVREHRRDRRRQHAGERRKGHAKREHHAVDHVDVDAQRLDHGAVVVAGADHHAQPGTLNDEIQRHRKHDAHGRDGEPIHRIAHHVGELDRRIEEGRDVHAMHVVIDEQAAQLLEHQNQSVGQQHLLEVVALVETGEQRPLEEGAEDQRQRNPEHDGPHEAARRTAQHEGHVGADHVETAVRKIDDAHDAENQRQTACHQKEQQAVLQRVQRLDQKGREIHDDPHPGRCDPTGLQSLLDESERPLRLTRLAGDECYGLGGLRDEPSGTPRLAQTAGALGRGQRQFGRAAPVGAQKPWCSNPGAGGRGKRQSRRRSIADVADGLHVVVSSSSNK